MSIQNNFIRSFQVNAAMSAFYRVTVSSNGKLDLAGVDVLGIGILQEDCTANTYETPAVRLWGTGTFKCAVTGNSITAGNTLIAVTGGLAALTNGLAGNTGIVQGMALETATGASINGTIIEAALTPRNI